MEIIYNDKLKTEYFSKYNFFKSHVLDFSDSCIVFVYNSIEKSKDGDLHISECVYNTELGLIKDAFHAIQGLKLFTFDSEDKFIIQASTLQKNYNKVYVYSMAQNLNGIGRRCLIPLLCEYYNFINLSSNSYSSFLGGNKHLMHKLLAPYINLPKRLFLTYVDQKQIEGFLKEHSNCLLKPNSESASIGIKRIIYNQNIDEIMNIIQDSISKYTEVILEEYIEGDEVECTIFPWNGDLFAAPPVKIKKTVEFLDYKTVKTDNYDFELYKTSKEDFIKEKALKAYSLLKFDSIARFDFIVNDKSSYLFDITPNPTISKCSSANLSVKFIDEDDRTIYLILLLNKLLIPALNKTK